MNTKENNTLSADNFLFALNRKIRGHVDKCDPQEITGWIFDEANPEKSILIDIVLDDIIVETVIADIFREDLFKANIGTGHYGFNLKLPDKCFDNAEHLLEIKDAINHELLAGHASATFFLERKSKENFNATGQKKQAILILGMHRSGTSALTRMMNLLGADLAPDLMVANFFNETGYWESLELANIHDIILSAFNSSWDDILDNNYFQNKNTQKYKDALSNYLIKTFSDSHCFVIKDPRLCKLIPLWLVVLTELDIDIKIIIPFRNPLEVAASLQTRNAFIAEKSFLMWLRCILEVEKQTRGLQRCFINYQQVLDDTDNVIKTISEQCQLQWRVDINKALQAINEFIDASQYHQRINSEQLAQSDVCIWISESYNLLNQLSLQDANNQTIILQQLDTIAAALLQADKLYASVIIDKHNTLKKLNQEALLFSQRITQLSKNF